MNDTEFDQYIKDRIQKEEPKQPGPSIDHVFDAAMKKARSKKLRYQSILSAAVLFLAVIVGSILLLQKGEPGSIAQKETEEPSRIAQKTKEESLAIKVDIEKEKQSLAAAGYSISRQGMPEEPDSPTAIVDLAYNFSLKDYVFNADLIIRGKILGTKSYIEDHVALTEAKMLVEDSLTGSAKKGEIITIVSSGGIISKYDFYKINGMDEKFNISGKELEAAKNEWVVEDYMSGIIYPDDEVYVFGGNDKKVTPTGEEVPWIGFRIKYTGGKIDSRTHYELEDTYAFEELRAMRSVGELHSKLVQFAEERKGYSAEKAKEAAYRALPKSSQDANKDWKSARAVFLSKIPYLDGEKVEPDLVEVIFPGKEYIRVYIKEKNLEVYKTIKEIEPDNYNYAAFKADLLEGKKISLAYYNAKVLVFTRDQSGWKASILGEAGSQSFKDADALLDGYKIDNQSLEEIFGARKVEYITVIE